ncbi:uncharacterized protein F54H12.2-like [Mizuhopecten yessoensis]|uniref:uncharacterized protein F54H12.2-like n=1 Tax=Mizuhopecten yessoensis TaxID=6573 RepID=UPI000B45B65F|nr:uncharacterized protein F54H12.2-like [Mizuhopecten yessoensis]
MAALNKEFFREAQPSELAIFDLPPPQTAVENIYYHDVLPLSQITSDSVVEFVVSGQNGLELLDLRNSLIYAKTIIKQMTIPTGTTNFTYDNIFQGVRPNLVVVGFVNATSTTGDYEQNPWVFKPYNVTSLGVYVDGIPVGGNPIKLKYSATGGQTTIPVLRTMLQSTGKWLDDTGSDIERDDIAKGYALYTFELEPTFQTNQYLTLLKQGNVRLEFIFGTAFTTAVFCIIYCEYPGYFEINAARDIVLP